MPECTLSLQLQKLKQVLRQYLWVKPITLFRNILMVQTCGINVSRILYIIWLSSYMDIIIIITLLFKRENADFLAGLPDQWQLYVHSTIHIYDNAHKIYLKKGFTINFFVYIIFIYIFIYFIFFFYKISIYYNFIWLKGQALYLWY